MSDSVKLEAYISRVARFAEWCEGKSVLHLGCSSGRFIEDRLARGDLLHENLRKRAARLVGVDLDKDSLIRMAALGYQDLHHGNAERLDEAGIDEKFEIIVAGDLLEHITRPGDMLDS